MHTTRSLPTLALPTLALLIFASLGVATTASAQRRVTPKLKADVTQASQRNPVTIAAYSAKVVNALNDDANIGYYDRIANGLRNGRTEAQAKSAANSLRVTWSFTTSSCTLRRSGNSQVVTIPVSQLNTAAITSGKLRVSCSSGSCITQQMYSPSARNTRASYEVNVVPAARLSALRADMGKLITACGGGGGGGRA